ncbi:MAG: Uncharacterized protein AUREO_053090 [Aureobasidium pullulans]|uniref:Rhodopsin domain-containing protein n=1 Tax=Aureobasidium pullulans TaxID=5580 RepID=A0A1A7MF57_AURPU|nr:MAG: Uncharacterized protein AUREO_053090 [Aureobasidium pullulans]THW44405.1 hypothetical protein D6D22_03998 [Aureobasidium pullulans]
MAANLTTVNGAPLPPGTYYFSRITDTDHAGYVWIVALLSLIYPFGTLLVRLNVRWGLYGADDWALVAATLAAVCQHIPIFVGLKAGFGKSSKVLERGQIASIDDSIYAAEVLFIFAYTLSKVSLALFVRRLFTHNRRLNTALCWSLLGITVAWEAALMIVPSYLVSGVMLGSRPKMLVMTAFAFRLAVIGFSITHLRRLSRTVDAEDKGFSFISPAIWIQIWLAWSLVSASIPSFRAFMNPFDNISVAKTDDSHSASRSELNGAYLMMGPISKPSHRNHGASARSASQGMSLSSKLGTRTSVHHESRDRGVDEARSMESWHSRSGIIRKEVEWEIRHDHEPL